MDSRETEQQKKAMRKAVKAKRDKAYSENPKAGLVVAERLFGGLDFLQDPGAFPCQKRDKTKALVVSAYWPLGCELDPLPTLERLCKGGFISVLPVMEGEEKPLIFRRWQPGDALVNAGFGTKEPEADKEELEPDVIITPLLAFDTAGHRLGYGGGFYDRTFARLRARKTVVAVAIAYAAQEVRKVVRGPYDQPLDFVVTEERILRF